MNIKPLVRHCPICDADSGEILYRQHFAMYEASLLPVVYNVVACTGCGFVFADTPASQADYDRYYRDYSKYEDSQVSSGSGRQGWEAERFQQTSSDIIRLLPNRDAAVLDVGSASGGLLAELSLHGYRKLSALEQAPACVDAVKEKGFGVYQGGITALPKTIVGCRFDSLLLSHVLEHLRDLEGALRNCGDLLVEGGLLYLETPDATRYHEFNITPYYFFDCEHINHFSLDSLRNLAERYGFVFVDGAAKTFRASTTNTYPAVWAAFRRSSAALPRVPQRDEAIRSSVLRHVVASEASVAMPEVDSLAVTGSPVIVWGAGSFAQRLLENSSLGRCNIRYFVDNDRSKRGKHLNGIEIRQPSQIDDPDSPILICAALFTHDIQAQIREMGLKNPVIPLVGARTGYEA